MMLDEESLPGFRELDKRLSSNNFGCFSPDHAISPWDKGIIRGRINPAVV